MEGALLQHPISPTQNHLKNLIMLFMNGTFNLTNTTSNHTLNETTPKPSAYGTQGMHPLYIALYTFAAILILPGLIGNSLIIATVSKLRTLHCATNYLICSLAAADLVMMFVMVAFLIYDGFQWRLPSDIQYWLFPSLDIAVASASIMSLAAVSFDRGLAVVRPLHYDQIFTRKRAIHIIKGIWGYVALIFTLSVLRCKILNKGYQYSVLTLAYFMGFIIPCIIVIISYAIILFTTLRIMKLSKTFERSLRSVRGEENQDKGQRTKKLQLHEAKVAVNFMLILVPFMLGWGFYFGTFWSEHIDGDLRSRSPLYEWFLLVIPWFISSINPIVYILFTKLLRHGCRKLIRKYITKRRHHDDMAASSMPTLQRIFTFGRRKSSLDTQSKSLLSLWSRSKRSSTASDVALSRIHRSSFLATKEEDKISGIKEKLPASEEELTQGKDPKHVVGMA